jgi:hypothetical protein
MQIVQRARTPKPSPDLLRAAPDRDIAVVPRTICDRLLALMAEDLLLSQQDHRVDGERTPGRDPGGDQAHCHASALL